ncbi:hypothetical protein PENTCL1PPCAC_9120, partial [Pristionchus entomophagus]
TSLIPEIAVQLKDGTIKSKIVRVPADPEAAEAQRMFDTGEMDFFSMNELNPIMIYAMSQQAESMFAKQCEVTLDSGVVEQLQKEKFDVYIVETIDICGMMHAHLIKPRAIIKTSTTTLIGEQFDEVGVPLALSFSPSMLTRSLDIHSITSRAWNIFAEQMTRLMHD